MITLNIVFEDFDGNEAIEDAHFHMTKLELAKWDTETGGLAKVSEELSHTTDPAEVLGILEELIRRSYGVRRGDKFVKSGERTEEFLSSDAYSELVIGFMEEPLKLVDFIAGVLPKSLRDEDAMEEVRAKIKKLA